MEKYRKLQINYMCNDISNISYALDTLELLLKEIYGSIYVETVMSADRFQISRLMVDQLVFKLIDLINHSKRFDKFVNKYRGEFKGCDSFELIDDESGLFKPVFNKEILRDRLKKMYNYFNELHTQMSLSGAKYCICDVVNINHYGSKI